jgi:hypothetical protein
MGEFPPLAMAVPGQYAGGGLIAGRVGGRGDQGAGGTLPGVNDVGGGRKANGVPHFDFVYWWALNSWTTALATAGMISRSPA